MKKFIIKPDDGIAFSIEGEEIKRIGGKIWFVKNNKWYKIYDSTDKVKIFTKTQVEGN